MKKLSINRACTIGFILLGFLSAAMITAFYFFTDNMTVVWLGILFALSVLVLNIFFICFLRHKLTLFADMLCKTIDEMLNGKSGFWQVSEEESLFYKINHRMIRLYEIMQKNKQDLAKERADLQELVSDISHQVKTPIANLQMINATLAEQEMTEEKRQEFLLAADGQLEKLNFLMQSMIKTSRLETGIISLEMKKQPVYDTLAAALGGILLSAEKKQIQVYVDCPEQLEVLHDRKWTAEALFNILDNAVKYTSEGGLIKICVQSWEFYMRIDIIDSDKVYNTSDMINIFTGMSDTLNAIKQMMMILTVIVTALIVVLMERSFISKEKSEIALMKAVGIPNSSIIAQHTLRFVIVSVLACIISLAVLMPISNVLMNWVCSMIGDVSGIKCDIDPVEIFALCPAILLTVTIIGSFLTALYTKTIKASDTASIE